MPLTLRVLGCPGGRSFLAMARVLLKKEVITSRCVLLRGKQNQKKQLLFTVIILNGKVACFVSKGQSPSEPRAKMIHIMNGKVSCDFRSPFRLVIEDSNTKWTLSK